jgi:hypothetical protein
LGYANARQVRGLSKGSEESSMNLFHKAMRLVRSDANVRPTKRPLRRRLRLESLESRELLTTAPFTIVNDMTNSSGGYVFSDQQLQVAIYSQDFSSATPPFYYFDSSGTEHYTQGLSSVPAFPLTSLTKTGDHSYTINIPESMLGDSANGPNSARVYISPIATPAVLTVNSDSVGSVNAPTPGNSYFDFFEFSLNAPNNPTGNLNIDTTNVDAFGFPIKIKLDSSDANNPANGVGIDVLRSSVISQFQTFTSDANDPFAVCLWPTSDGTNGPYRISSPGAVLSQGRLTGNTFVHVQTTVQNPVSNSTQTTVNVYSAQDFPDPADGSFVIQIGNEKMLVTGSSSGQGVTTNWTVERGYQGTVATSHLSGAIVSMPNPVMTSSQTTMTVAGTSNFPTTYPFTVRVDSEDMTVTGVKSNNPDGTTTWNVTRGQGGTTAVAHDESAPVFYDPVISLGLNSYFNTAIDDLFGKYTGGATFDLGYTDPTTKATITYTGTTTMYQGNEVLQFHSSSDPGAIYNVYYPFFNDNRYYWSGFNPTGTVGDAPQSAIDADVVTMSPSAMVFNCNCVFADNKYQTTYVVGGVPHTYTADQLKVLGNLENQVVSALNRGVAQLPSYNASDPTGTWSDNNEFYKDHGEVWNRYAQFLHEPSTSDTTGVSIDGKNYGFAFDDQGGNASDIGVASFNSATITLEPWGTSGPGPGPGPGPLGNGISIRYFVIPKLPQSAPPSGSSSTPPPVVHSSTLIPRVVTSSVAITPAMTTVAPNVTPASKPPATPSKPATTSSSPSLLLSMRSLISSRSRH